jgi:membrane protein required for colicin V production
MLIDIILLVLLVLAAIKGYSKGLIIAVFSFVAIIVGLAAALKLSAVAASYIGNAVKISDQWLPVISFLVVFLVVVLLIRLGARLLEKTIQVALLGWVNRLGGIIFYAAFYLTIYSVLLFYAVQMELIKPATIQQSTTYQYIAPWGSKIIDSIGVVLPFLKNSFTDLEHFFGGLASKA